MSDDARTPGPERRVVRVDACDLSVVASAWPFATREAAAIDAHWAKRQRDNAEFFNGRIYVLERYVLEGDAFHGRFVPTDFKSYLYWRETGFPEAGVKDCFGSALIRSAEGHVMLGRQRKGHVNSGLAYLPGGFIDRRDVASDGTIAIDASIRREIAEETGLDAGDLRPTPGYLMTFAGALISIAAEFRSPLPAEALRAEMLAHIAADPASELTDVVIVHAASEIADLALVPFARVLLEHLFAVPQG